MELHERIKHLRKEVDMTQDKFGKKIGVSRDVVNNMERGRVEIKEDRIKLICSVFGVSKDWLKNGNGEMYQPDNKNQEILSFANDTMELSDEHFKKRFIEALIKLDENDWKHLEAIVSKLLKED